MPRSKGFRHSPETKAKIAKSVSRRSRRMWASMSEEERAERRRQISEGYQKQSDALKKRRSYATSEGLKKYWSGQDTAKRSAVGQRLKTGRKRWKEQHPEKYAAVQAARIEAVKQHHKNISPEQKATRTERSVRGKLEKAKARAASCLTVDWTADKGREQSIRDRLKRKAKGGK